MLSLSKFVQKIFFRNSEIITTSIPKKAKLNTELYLKHCYQNLLKKGSLFCCLVSFPSRTVRLLTRQSFTYLFIYLLIYLLLVQHWHWLKTASPPAAVNSLAKTNGHQTRRMLTLLIYHIWGVMSLNTTSHFILSQRTLMDWRKSCS